MPNFIKNIRAKLDKSKVEGGEGDVGPDGLASMLGTQRAKEDYAVSVVNPPEKPLPAKFSKGGGR